MKINFQQLYLHLKNHISDYLETRYSRCRCGKVHTGPYGIYDYGHHNCFHDERLSVIGQNPLYLICPMCGKTWDAEETSAVE